MDENKVAKELVKAAKMLIAKPEIDFEGIADEIENVVDEIDSHMNTYQRDYDRGTASQINKATRHLIEASKMFAGIIAYDEDPLG